MLEAGTALKFPLSRGMFPILLGCTWPGPWAVTDPGPGAVQGTLRAIPMESITGNCLCLGKFWDFSALECHCEFVSLAPG